MTDIDRHHFKHMRFEVQQDGVRDADRLEFDYSKPAEIAVYGVIENGEELLCGKLLFGSVVDASNGLADMMSGKQTSKLAGLLGTVTWDEIRGTVKA